MGFRNLLRRGSYLDLDYIYGDALTNAGGEYPLDYQAMAARPETAKIVATDVATGQPVYFDFHDMAQDDYGAIKASCCVPVVNRPYRWRGKAYYDGGLSDPIPFQQASQAGCDRVEVILTRPKDYYRDPNKDQRKAKLLRKSHNAARVLAGLAPLHNGPEAKGAEVMRALLPDVPQIFVFDSSFFFQLPKAASTYALNKEIADQYHIRRYGAHGTSHEFISSVVPGVIGKPAEGLKQIVLHIGNGASASAEVSGKPVETSMGLTPLEGLMMGGRTGDIDPAVVFHLIRNAHMNVDELDTLFNKRSGMMGMTGFGDLREVHRLVAEGNEDAKLALDVYVHRIVSYIGNYTYQMGGCDVITFTAGVGENDDIVRKMVCDKLAPFGVKLDEEKNAKRSKEPRIISTPDSSVIIAVIPTNEELAIARKSAEIAENGADTYGNTFAK